MSSSIETAPENVPGDLVLAADSSASNETTTAGKLVRNAQITFSQSRPPVGMFHAFGSLGSNIPTLNDIQTGKFEFDGWSGPGQRRNSSARRDSDVQVMEIYRQRTASIPLPTRVETITEKVEEKIEVVIPESGERIVTSPHDPSVPYANGYQFPPKHTKKQATLIALRGFGRFIITPFGFLLTIYALNIVAWGGMLFLILIHATPAMAHPSYNDDYSGAKIWLEITAQILNALFCVTGLGLIPWRFRDLWHLLQFRLRRKEGALRKLAGIHRDWFRLEGSQDIDINFHPATDSLPAGVNESALALPIKVSPDAPLTGERASPSKYWLLDFVVWMFVLNTFLQILLCVFMWGFNRFERPSAAVGALISLACIVASAAGYMIFREGKRVKKVEGVPVSKDDQELLREMREKGGEGGIV
ncbi:hypothetical protein HYFRA_00011358 [Hymenoscyphus fraxineus]|uniref:Uncharacterized protein n=1 Tax=Hymenoscyphus fraxineus TaxID=746836 RepID=A0A9N9KXM7_9HELO|nr:hypothetical protein HYFRA_00011358 [Hymenoscyphus fraxineus]